MTHFRCKVCNEDFFDTLPGQSNSSVHRPPFWLSCSICGRHQNWLGIAKQPAWWPSRLKTVDRVNAQWRWTHWTLSLAIATSIIMFFVGPVIVSGISNAISGPSAKKELSIPSMVGMNLQAAQDCLQELGFFNLDDQPADASEPRFQINDSNWTVRRQNRTGPVSSKEALIVLYAEKTGGGGDESCP